MAWSDMAAMATLGIILSGLLYMVLRSRLATDFVTRDMYAETVARTKAIEVRLEMVPTHEDFKAVNANVAGVALQMATMTERVDGLKGSMGRIEKTLTMFVEARLQWEKDR